MFEPAYADLLLDDQEARHTGRRSTTPRFVAALVLAFESFRLGMPTYFWQDGRVTRFGKSTITVVVSSIIVVLVLTTLGSQY